MRMRMRMNEPRRNAELAEETNNLLKRIYIL